MNETLATVRMIDGATAPAISNVFANNACALCTLQITGTFTAATVFVEGIVNVASNQWVTLAAFNLSDLSLEKDGANEAGIYQVGIEGILRMRMNVTEISGGDITIAAQFGNATINQFSETEASNLVPITAYDLAVAGGYTGTLEQFETDLGNSASNATAAANSADEAAASAESVSASAAQIATNTGDISNLKTQFDDVTTTTGEAEVLDTSENLATSLSRGYYTTVSGTMSFNNNANFSNMKVPVIPGTKYQINKTHNIYGMDTFNALGVFVDASGNYINTIAGVYGGIPTSEPYDVVAPENSAMMYLSTDYVYTESNVETTIYKYVFIEAIFLDNDKLARPPVYFSEIAATGKKIKIIAGVVRNTGNGWQYINDSGHEPLNLIRVSVDANGKLQIDYGFTAKKVLSLVATPDETFANLYTIGGSVGLDKTLFNIYTLPVNYGGLATVSNNAVNVNNSTFTSGSFNTTSGEIRLYHTDLSAIPTKQKFNISAICNSVSYNVITGSNGNDYISLFLKDASGNIIKDTTGISIGIIANRMVGIMSVNANDIVSSGGNFWIYGVMEID